MARLNISSTLLFSTLLFVFVAGNTHAQLGKRIQQRIKETTERKLEDKVVNKAGEKTDQALDSLFKKRKRPGSVSSEKKSSGSVSSSEGSNENGTQRESQSESSGFDFGGMLNAKYESSYTLDIEFVVEMKSQEKPRKKVETANMNMSYGADCFMMVYKDEQEAATTKTLMDLKNNTSIVLNDADMSGVAISMDFMTDKMNESIENYQDSIPDDEDYTFRKTGKTKTIAGYSCDEYYIETEDMTMNVWYTEDITVEMYQNLEQFPMFGSMTSAAAYGSNGQLTGTMMEAHMVEKKDQGKFDYLVKEVNESTQTLNLNNYTFMKM